MRPSQQNFWPCTKHWRNKELNSLKKNSLFSILLWLLIRWRRILEMFRRSFSHLLELIVKLGVRVLGSWRLFPMGVRGLRIWGNLSVIRCPRWMSIDSKMILMLIWRPRIKCLSWRIRGINFRRKLKSKGSFSKGSLKNRGNFINRISLSIKKRYLLFKNKLRKWGKRWIQCLIARLFQMLLKIIVS